MDNEEAPLSVVLDRKDVVALEGKGVSRRPICAFDMGGTLTKAVYFVADASDGPGGKLVFSTFSGSDRVRLLLDYVDMRRKNQPHLFDEGSIHCTGGGAVKYGPEIECKLERSIFAHDEVNCIVSGVRFASSNFVNDAYRLDTNSCERVVLQKDQVLSYPFLIVMVGSGISVIRVQSATCFERVGGTSVGGSTFLGLATLLTGVSNFFEVLALAGKGNNESCDLLVGDIYGQAYDRIGLDEKVIAGSFGKMASNPEEVKNVKKEDVLASLLAMMSFNISQVAFLTALRFGITELFFCGAYVRGHKTRAFITKALSFWSHGEMKANFLRHGSYVGALGAFITSTMGSGAE